MLPEELFDYFEITDVKTKDKFIDVYLDELNVSPPAYKHVKLSSNGFHAPVAVQDFSTRGRAVFLHIRRRKWKVEETGQIISNSWDTTAEGTRYTKSFASFLKGIFGQLPDQQQKGKKVHWLP
ncbi:ISAon1 family transposase N-terminal region protein [Gaoshiqia sediminis]|uniref:ISAon1 family transposase N-terminal region protein n=1 Tax=Gaoshiqia sediminis TaxID=2986998 RepID=UPI003D0DA905